MIKQIAILAASAIGAGLAMIAGLGPGIHRRCVNPSEAKQLAAQGSRSPTRC